MSEFIALEYADSYGVSIGTARRLTNEEKQHYLPDVRDRIFVGTDKDNIDLKFVSGDDLPKREADGMFLDCANRAYIISDAERDRFVRLNAERAERYALSGRRKSRQDLKLSITPANKLIVKIS